MKKILPFLLVLTGSLWLANAGAAAETNSVTAQLNALITRINAKLARGQNTAADLADNLKQFDALLAEHKGDTSDAVANVLAAKAQVYLEVLNDPENAVATLKQLKRDFPKSELSQRVDAAVASLQPSIEKQRIRAKLVPGASFPAFETKDFDGKPLSLADFKGKVVLLDFWATWCPPCVAEVPTVVSLYKKFHSRGFDIIGISLDDSRAKLASFIKDQGMTWPEYFDGLHWDSKLAVKYGVDSTPTTYLLGRDGRILATNLRGEALANAVAKALAD